MGFSRQREPALTHPEVLLSSAGHRGVVRYYAVSYAAVIGNVAARGIELAGL